MKKLLFLFSISLAFPAFADTKISDLEQKVADLEKQNQQREGLKTAEQRMRRESSKRFVGMTLLALSGGALAVAGGWGSVCAFAASLEHMKTVEFLKCFSTIGVPALAVAATSGYFGTKMTLGGSFGLLKNPLLKNQEVK